MNQKEIADLANQRQDSYKSLREKALQLIQSCDLNTRPDSPALLQLRELLNKGIRLDEENVESGNNQEDNLPTPIHHAAKTGSPELMRELAKTQALDVKTATGLTALHIAAAGLHHDLVKILVARIDRRAITTNLHPNQAERGWTALHYAAAATELNGSFTGQWSVIKLLLETDDHTVSQSIEKDLRNVRDSMGRLPQHIFRLHHLSHRQGDAAGADDSALAYVDMQRLLSPPMQSAVQASPRLDKLMRLKLPTDEELSICIETPVYIREYVVLDKENHGLTIKSFYTNELCVADAMYGRGLDYLESPSRGRDLDLPPGITWRRGFRWMHIPGCNKTWLHDLVRACFVQRLAKLPDATSGTRSLRLEHSELQDAIRHLLVALSGPTRTKLVFPFTVKSDRQQPKNGMILAVPYLTTCPAIYYKEILDECAKSRSTDHLGSEQMNHDVVMRLIRTYGNRDILHMPTSLQRYGRIVSLSEDIGLPFKEQVLYKLQARGKGEIDDKEKLVCVVSQLWLCLIKGKDFDHVDTLITLSPDVGMLSKTFNLGRELHHYSGVDSDLDPWISEVQKTAKIIPFIIALTARTSLECTLEVQRGAAKHGLLEVYAMAVSNAASHERKLVDSFWKHVKKETKGDGDSLKITIKEEMRLIRETKKIINELGIVKRVLADQLRLIIETSHSAGLDHRVQGEAIKMSMVGVNSRRVDDLVKNAEETINDVYSLLDLKQKGANLAETQWTRRQAEETARQGNIIMVFTIVTTIFLPLSFISSFFALEVIEFPRDDEGELRLGINWILTYLFAITAAVALPVLLVAFNINWVTSVLKNCRDKLLGHQDEMHNKVDSPVAGHTRRGAKEVSQSEGEEDEPSLEQTAPTLEDTNASGRKKHSMAHGIGKLLRRRANEKQQVDEVAV